MTDIPKTQMELALERAKAIQRHYEEELLAREPGPLQADGQPAGDEPSAGDCPFPMTVSPAVPPGTMILMNPRDFQVLTNPPIQFADIQREKTRRPLMALDLVPIVTSPYVPLLMTDIWDGPSSPRRNVRPPGTWWETCCAGLLVVIAIVAVLIIAR